MNQLPADLHARYEVLRKLGEGGMGLVFEVRHRLLGERRVVKVIRAHHAEDEAVRERFRREAKAATRLRHPNIAQIQDFHVGDDGRAYLVMELIDGLTLKQLIHLPETMPVDLAVDLGLQGLAALGYLHGQGYLHRDVAPDNLMLTRGYDGRPRVKLIDLGLAKRQAETVELTATNMFVGKVRYASPELFRRPLTEPSPISDLYSFGVVLYELMTGICPIQGSSFEELMASHLLDEPLPFEKTDPEGRIDEELRQILLKALAKKPEDRFPTAAEFIHALERHHRPDPRAMARFEELYGQHWQRPAETSSLAATDSSTLAAGLGADGVGVGRGVDDAREAVLAGPSEEDSGTPPGGTLLVGQARATGKGGGRRLALGLGGSALVVVALVVVALVVVALLAAFGVLDLPFAAWMEDWGSGSTPETRTVEGTAGDSDGDAQASNLDLASDLGPAGGLGQGRLVLSASPWAEIVSVVDGQGRPVPFSGPLHTPTLLALPADTYRIELRHPSSDEPRTLEVKVPITGTERRSADFGAITAEDYLVGAGLGDWLETAGTPGTE